MTPSPESVDYRFALSCSCTMHLRSGCHAGCACAQSLAVLRSYGLRIAELHATAYS